MKIHKNTFPWSCRYGKYLSFATLVILSKKNSAIWPLVSRSLGHSVTQSLGHSFTRSLGHLVTRSLNHSITGHFSHSYVCGSLENDQQKYEWWKWSKSMEWPNDQITKWPSDRVTVWLSDRVTEWPSDRVTEWPSDRVTKRQSDRLTEQPSDQVTKWLEVTFKKHFSTFQSTLIHYMEKKGSNLRSKNSIPSTMA